MAGARLTLRAPTSTDRAFLTALLSNPQTRAYLGGPVPPERLGAAIDGHLNPPPDTEVWIAQTDHPIGVLHLNPHREEPGLELAFQLLPGDWGQGLAFEACSALIAAKQGPQMVAETQSANAASLRLLARLGFVRLRETMRFGAKQTILTRPCGPVETP